jgi:virulence factor Mce-like protein
VNTQPLNAARIVVVAAFALVCFGLMLYLWDAFGGAVPLKPKGYRVVVALPEADLLSTQADVRIAGVSVGKVVSTGRHPSTTDPNRKDAVLEIDHEYAPLHTNVRAMIRRKSIAGEEYLELTPGTPVAPAIPDGGRLANAQVAPSVEIDELLRTFDPRTRRNLEAWIQGQAASIQGRGGELNEAFGTLPGFETDLTRLFQSLHRQQAAVRLAVRNTGEVFDALSERRDALHGLIVNSKRATDAFATQSKAFADTWRAFPPFEKNSIRLLHTAEAFRRNADPVLTALRPGFREFGRTLEATKPTAHELNGLMRTLSPLADAGRRGLPAARQFFQMFRPFLAEWPAFLDQFNPLLAYIGQNADSIPAVIANLTSLTEDSAPGYGAATPLHYIRASAVLNPQGLTLYPDQAFSGNRANPYPNGADRLTDTTPYKVFDNRGCRDLKWPVLAEPAPGTLSPTLIERLRHFALNDGVPVAPPCLLQKPSGSTTFPHVEPLSHQSRGEP